MQTKRHEEGITLKHKFVESLPDALEQNTLYVCMEFATVAHKCCCGCEREVVTPLSPTDWKLIYDGRTVRAITKSCGSMTS